MIPSDLRVPRATHAAGWLLLGALVLALACPGDDDDDATGDDDVSGDDDTTGDDDDASWIDLFDEVDAEGDGADGGLDLRALQYRRDGSFVELRAVGWDPFDAAAVTADVWIGDDDRAWILRWDADAAGSVELWGSANRLAAPLDAPASLTGAADGDRALVLGVDLTDLGLETRCSLLTRVGTDGSPGAYADLAPDDGAPLAFDAAADRGAAVWAKAVAIDDTAGGDGDGIADAGEYLDAQLWVTNEGCEPSGGGLAGSVEVAGDSTIVVSVLQGDVGFGTDGLAPGETAPADAAVELAIGAGAAAGGRGVLRLTVEDDHGDGWTSDAPPLIVGAPRQVALAQLAADDDDSERPLDAALVGYAIEGDTLIVSVFSYGVHDGDQQVDVQLDLDLDGHHDAVLSTLADDGVSLTGSVTRVDPWSGLVALGAPSVLDNDAGSDALRIGVPLDVLGDPLFALVERVAIADPGQPAHDLVPDEPAPGDPDTMPLIATVDAPYLRVVELLLTEDSGDGDDDVEPGERWEIKVHARNDGPAAAAGATGSLRSDEGAVIVEDADVTFGEAAGEGGLAWTVDPAMVSIDAGATSPADVSLVLDGTAEGYPFSLSIPLHIGP